MHALLERMERWVDRSLPVVFLLLTVLLVAEFFVDIHDYEPYVTLADYLIVAVFVADLAFKWTHVRMLKPFVRLYWVDIIAVFPFYSIFRAYLFFFEILPLGEEAQKLLHEAVLLRETRIVEEIRLIREAEFAAKEAGFAGRMIRFLQRSWRLIAIRWHEAHANLLRAHKRQRHGARPRRR